MSKVFNSYSLPIIELQTSHQTQQQIREFAAVYNDISPKYEPIEPLAPRNPPLFSKPIQGYYQLESTLYEIRGKSQAEINAQAEKVFARISKEMRKDANEMLQVVHTHPRALSLVSPEILTKEFVAEAIQRNYKVYDALPLEWQQDKHLALLYAKEALNQAECHNIGKDEHGRTLGAHLPLFNPNCPLELIAEDLYKEAAKRVLERGSGLTENTPEQKYVTMGAAFSTMLLLQSIKPELQERIPQLEKEILTEHKETLLSKARVPIDKSDWVFELCEKHNMPEYAQEFCEAAWQNKCAQMVSIARSDIGTLGDFAKELQDCPKHILAAYVNPETFEPYPTDSLTLEASKLAKEAAQLAEQDMLTNSVYVGLRAFKMSEISVVQENFDFENIVKKAAERASICQAGELWAAPQPISGRYPYEYPSYLSQMNSQNREYTEMEKFINNSPRLSALYHSEIQRLQTERQNWTPQEQEWHRLQQLAYQKVQGDRQLDYEIIQCVKNNPNGEYSKHLDVADYLNRRAEYLFCYSSARENSANIQAFQQYLSAVPEAKALITAVDAKHLESQFAFSYDPYQSGVSQDVMDYLQSKRDVEQEFGFKEWEDQGRSRDDD